MKAPKKKYSETLIIAGFVNDQESSVFYRKYKKKCSLSNVVLKILSAHAVDIISIRVINRRKQLKLDSFVKEEVIPLENLETIPSELLEAGFIPKEEEE